MVVELKVTDKNYNKKVSIPTICEAILILLKWYVLYIVVCSEFEALF